MADVLAPFEQAVLLALLQLSGDAYGRAVLNEVQRRLNRDVAAGAVGASLERLEAKRLVSSRLAPGTAVRAGRPRRYYAPTAAGVRALNEAKSSIDALWDAVAWPLRARP